MSTEKTHDFVVIFNSRHVQMENHYTFDVYPIYWQTEIVQGKANLIGDAYLGIPNYVLEIPPPPPPPPPPEEPPPPPPPPLERTIISASAEFLSESETRDWTFVVSVVPYDSIIKMGLYIEGRLNY